MQTPTVISTIPGIASQAPIMGSEVRASQHRRQAWRPHQTASTIPPTNIAVPNAKHTTRSVSRMYRSVA